jgi:carbonic anhydrase/acetyltransferase-like protein (isoleucine patch superfamily)
MSIYRLSGNAPQVPTSAFVADDASVIGRVSLGEQCSVWFGAVIRGDNEPIRIGAGSNVQEGAVLHVDPGFPMTIGEGVTIGHQAMLHGCSVGDGTLIGIQAVILNGAVIGKNCLVAAGALVTERKVFPDHSLILGVPAKVARELTDEELANLAANASGYVDKSAIYSNELERIA